MNVAVNMDSRRLYPVIAWWLALGICWAQVPEVTNEPTYHFGVTVVAPYGFCGWVYELPERQGIEELRVETVRPPFAPARTRPNCAVTLPQFQRLQPVGNIYTMKLNVQPRDFTEGFPGVTGRFEWFAIDYTARFWIETPGKYSFQLLSDDGSALYIDERRIINNDCVHRPLNVEGSARLDGGIHEIRVSYFQGPRFQVALALYVKPPKEGWRVFDLQEFKPPPNPADWKYSNSRYPDVPADPCKAAKPSRTLILRP